MSRIVARHAVCVPIRTVRNLLRLPIALLLLAAPAAGATRDDPPPSVDEWTVALRAAGLDRSAAGSAYDLPDEPDAPPAATQEEQIAELVNIQRAACPVSGWCTGPRAPLKFLPLLTGVADEHSESMAIHDYFSHCDFTSGTNSGQRATAAGYIWNFVGENIAAGNSTASATMAQWMNSSGHRNNILSSNYRELGAGYYRQTGDLSNIDYDANGDCDCTDAGENCSFNALQYYWTQVFGARTSVYPMIIEGEKHQVTTGTVALYVYGPAGADDMRFSNDGVTWSNWQTYQAETTWQLAGGDGLRTVFSEVRNGSTVYPACDTIWRTGAGGGEIFSDSFDCYGYASWSLVSP